MWVTVCTEIRMFVFRNVFLCVSKGVCTYGYITRGCVYIWVF